MPARRKSNRLPGFDYSSSGAYFVTICVHQRLCRLGSIQHGSIRLTSQGEIADQTWSSTHDHFIHITIDTHITMPNHVHAIIMIHSPRRGGVTPPLQKSLSLGRIVAYYKYLTTKQINLRSQTPGERFWQRNFYDHIIRNEEDLDHHRRYIRDNPLRWELDTYYALA